MSNPNLCNARFNKTVPCNGEFIKSEGCCLRHAVLFDVWICDEDGFRVYKTEYPLNWKRSKFHQWLNSHRLAWFLDLLRNY